METSVKKTKITGKVGCYNVIAYIYGKKDNGLCNYKVLNGKLKGSYMGIVEFTEITKTEKIKY